MASGNIAALSNAKYAFSISFKFLKQTVGFFHNSINNFKWLEWKRKALYLLVACNIQHNLGEC